MPKGLASRHPVPWFTLDATVSWALVVRLNSPEVSGIPLFARFADSSSNAAIFVGLAALGFGVWSGGAHKGRPWPTVPLGLGLARAFPVIPAIVLAPKPKIAEGALTLIVHAMCAWLVFVRPIVAAALTLQASREVGRRSKSE